MYDVKLQGVTSGVKREKMKEFGSDLMVLCRSDKMRSGWQWILRQKDDGKTIDFFALPR